MAANDHTFGANAAPGDHPPANAAPGITHGHWRQWAHPDDQMSESADEVESADGDVTFPIQNRSEFGGAAF